MTGHSMGSALLSLVLAVALLPLRIAKGSHTCASHGSRLQSDACGPRSRYTPNPLEYRLRLRRRGVVRGPGAYR